MTMAEHHYPMQHLVDMKPSYKRCFVKVQRLTPQITKATLPYSMLHGMDIRGQSTY
jgi:hypothetical protein